MGYKILGYVVWNGGKIFIRRKYGTTAPKVAAGGVVATAILAIVLTARASSSDD